MPISFPTFDEYRAAQEVTNLYEQAREQFLQDAILEGRVRPVTKSEQAWNALGEYLDERPNSKPFTVAAVHEEAPATRVIHGKTVAAQIRRRQDYKQVGFTPAGASVFDRVALPRSSK